MGRDSKDKEGDEYEGVTAGKDLLATWKDWRRWERP
jgi:hypothetical protein